MTPEPPRPATSRPDSDLDDKYVWPAADNLLAPRHVLRLMIVLSRLDYRHLLRN